MNVKKLFLEYFQSKNHQEYPSCSLIPNNDKSLLFVNSGMVQFKDIFLGNVKPKHTRIVSCQKCMRAGGKHNDLDNIGFTSRHHSFFEMLGNFSFGDYFKEEAIEFAWDFLINHLKLDKKRLYISVHTSDEESKKIWIDKIGIDKKKVLILGDEDNFWQMGDTGPCGPCTEIYYDLGNEYEGVLPSLGDPKDRYIEIWNLVFTQYNKTENGFLEELPQKCVDTGMGLERVQAIVEGLSDNYESSLFTKLSNFIDERVKLNKKNIYVKKILLDHIRACCHLISDNVIPDREGRGYVLRRILRRSSRFIYKYNIKEPFLFECAEVVCKDSTDFPSLRKDVTKIIDIIKTEEIKYLKTLGKGMEIIDEYLKTHKSLSGDTIFNLYDTYGFPYEITEEIAAEKNIKIDKKGYEKLMFEQKNKARGNKSFADKSSIKIDAAHTTEFLGYNTNNQTASIIDIYHNDKKIDTASSINQEYLLILSSSCLYPEGGGQISDIGTISSDNCLFEVRDVQKINKTIVHECILISGKANVADRVMTNFDENRRKRVAANHSSTHLLHHYLRAILGDHVQQRGSSVTDKGFRFDFTHNKVVSDKQIKDIEASINNEIFISTKTKTKYSPYDNAIESGALAFFDEKYDDEVRVVSIGKQSIELCGGTHVSNTSEIGVLKIVNQSSVANGVRRLECVTGPSVLDYINYNLEVLKNICGEFQATSDNILNKVNALKDEVKSLKKKNAIYSKDYLTNLISKFTKYETTKNIPYFIENFDDLNSDEIKSLSDITKSKIKQCIVFFVVTISNNTTCYISVSKNIISSYNAKNLSKAINEKFSGKGGGSETFATCILAKIDMKEFKEFITEILE